MAHNGSRPDLEAIAALIPSGARVLDLGCGDGTLLAQLVAQKQVWARGVELSEANVRACIARGLSVRQGNIEEGLADFPNDAFDYVILSQTLAYLDQPVPVVREMLRVGRRAIISFENAGYWRVRWRMLIGQGVGEDLCSGEARTRAITLGQFVTFAQCVGAQIEAVRLLSGHRVMRAWPTWLTHTAVYVLRRALAPVV